MLKRFISYYAPHKGLFALDMLASLFISIIGLCYPLLTRKMLDDYIPNKQLNLIILFGGFLLIMYFIRMLLRFFVQYYGHIIGVKMQAQMRSDMFRHLQQLPYSFFDENVTKKHPIKDVFILKLSLQYLRFLTKTFSLLSKLQILFVQILQETSRTQQTAYLLSKGTCILLYHLC